MLFRVNLCDGCARRLSTIMSRLGRAAMAAEAGSILQSCPECSAQLPPTEGKLFTALDGNDQLLVPITHVDVSRRVS